MFNSQKGVANVTIKQNSGVIGTENKRRCVLIDPCRAPSVAWLRSKWRTLTKAVPDYTDCEFEGKLEISSLAASSTLPRVGP